MRSFHSKRVSGRISVFLICALCSVPALADSTPEETVANYIRDFSNGVDPQVLVDTYWLPSLVTFSAGSHPAQIPASEFAGMLDAFRKQVREQGWVRSTIVESEHCVLRDDVAIVNIRYSREFKDGTAVMDAVLYTLVRDGGWKLSSVMTTNPALIVSCAESDQ